MQRNENTLETVHCQLHGDALTLLAQSEHNIHITGCSGWFGRCTLEALYSALGAQAFQARVRPYTSGGGVITLRDGTLIPTLRFDSLPEQRDTQSVLLHYAYLTKERTASMALGDYLDANRVITDTVLNALAPLGCRAVFMPSSGAIYRPDVSNADVTLSNAYGKLKLEDEARLRQWAEAAPGRSAAICRVFNVSGPYINKYSDYALSSIIDAALRGLPVRIRTPRRTLRSFVAVEEVVSLAFGLLLAPPDPCVVLDTAGEEAYEINDLVREVGLALDREVALERPPLSDDEDRYLGSRAPYLAMLGRYHVTPVSMREQILQTAGYIRQFPGT
jgi:nucleoside-diphosphate-sugar epimerase